MVRNVLLKYCLFCPDLARTLPGPCPGLAQCFCLTLGLLVQSCLLRPCSSLVSTLPAPTLPQPCFLPGPYPGLAQQPCPDLAPTDVNL